MYLSKNSRCILQKSPWFSVNLLERNFKITYKRRKARLPEEDVTKPPLRINIPKEAPIVSQYQICCEDKGKIGQTLANSKSKSDVMNENNPQPLFDTWAAAEEQVEISKNQTERTLDEYDEVFDNRNSESNSFTNNKSASSSSSGVEKKLSDSEKNFKLRKIRSYEGIKLNSDDNEIEINDKNGIVTIEISLKDRVQGDSVTEVSQLEAAESLMSDEQIAALAEAIICELKRIGDVADPQVAKCVPSQEDEAFLVIINVTDKEAGHESLRVHDNAVQWDNRKRKRLVEDQRRNSACFDSYVEQLQVRDLELNGVAGKRLFKTEARRKKDAGKMLRYACNQVTGRARGMFKNQNSSENVINNDSESKNKPGVCFCVSNLQDMMRLRKKKKTDVKNGGKLCSQIVDIAREKERRKKFFERTVQNGRLPGPILKDDHQTGKILTSDKIPLLNSLPDTTKNLPIPPKLETVNASEGDSIVNSEILPEDKIEELNPEEAKPLPGITIISSILKPLSQHVTFIDELPELLRYPDYKYTMLMTPCLNAKKLESDKLIGESQTIRGYHNSCSNFINEKGDFNPPCDVSTKVDDNNAGKSTKNCNHEEITASGIPKGENVKNSNSQQYDKPKLDEIINCTLSENLKGSDVYLQETNKIDESVITETGNADILMKCLTEELPKKSSENEQKLSGSAEKLDITENLPKPAKISDEFRPSPNVEENQNAQAFFAPTKETWDLNTECLNVEKSKLKSSHDLTESFISESLLNSKKDTIINVVKCPSEGTTPKMSDNIVNLANETLAESKGSTSVDSLSMMKKVKEIVDLDLKNAEKIFNRTENTNSECKMEHLEQLCVKKDWQSAEPVEEPLPPSEISTPCDLDLSLLKSVIVYDERKNHFYINKDELNRAMTARRLVLGPMVLYEAEDFSLDFHPLQIMDFNKDDIAVYSRIPQNCEIINDYATQRGDSIVFHDENTKSWKLDFSSMKKTESDRFEEVRTSTGFPIGYDAVMFKTGNNEGSEPDISKNAAATKIEKDAAEKTQKPKEEIEKAEKKEESACKTDPPKESNAEEIRRKNSDLYDELFVDLKKQPQKPNEEVPLINDKKTEITDKTPAEHYVSDNIVEMSKQGAIDKSSKVRSTKIETVKLNISPTMRPPSKVTEINLHKKDDESKSSTQKDTPDAGKSKSTGDKTDSTNGTFYKKFEKYKTHFSDPEYEEKPMKINSDLKSNPNLKKLDSCNKTLVLQEISKSSENVDSWLKDETDKMATLLLKVLQEAAEGNSRKRIASKSFGKGNPYEAIRKKQENGSGLFKSKKKDFMKKKEVPLIAAKVQTNSVDESFFAREGSWENFKTSKGRFPVVRDEADVEVVVSETTALNPLTETKSESASSQGEDTIDDIPGPRYHKGLSSLWSFFPKIGCQSTIFFLIKIFQLARSSLSLFSVDVGKLQNDPFRNLFVKYGPVVRIQGPLSGNVVLVSKPEDVACTLTQAPDSPARSVFDSVESCRLRERQKNFSIGITDPCNGIDWEIVRKGTTDVLSQGSLQFFNMLRGADKQLIDTIKAGRNRQNQIHDDFVTDIQKWSLEGLCGILFDKSLGFLEKKNSQIEWISESERIVRHLKEASDYLCMCESNFQFWRFINTPALSTLGHAYQALDLIISKHVYQAEVTLRKKRKAISNSNLNTSKNLNFLESALLNDRMTPEEVTANIIDIMLIGVNTNTIALSFLLYNLAQNNRVQRQLFMEIKELLPKKDSQLYYHQLHSLKYLQACLKESLRLNVPIPLLLRVLPKDIALGNYKVPKGTYMVMDNQLECMKGQNFDEPERFKPERWLDYDNKHPFAPMPFCNGPRAAFVKRLAEVQLWTCAAKIIRNYEIEYHFGDIKGTGNVLSYPDKPLKLTFIERNE